MGACVFHRAQVWLAALSVRLFRDRHVLIRDGDRLRSLYFTRRAQKSLVIGAATMTFTVIGLSAGLLWQEHRIDEQSERFRTAQTERGKLATNVSRILSDSRVLVREMPRGAPAGVAASLSGAASQIEQLRLVVRRLAERHSTSRARLARSQRRAEVLQKRLTSLRRTKADVKAELADVRETLSAVSSGRENLGDQLAETLADLHRARNKRQAALSAQAATERRVVQLGKRLSRLQRRKESLTDKVASLDRNVSSIRRSRDRLLKERKTLSARVGRLESTLGYVAHADGNDLLERISNLENALITAEKQNASYKDKQNDLRDKVADLQGRLQKIKKTQSGLFNHYKAQAQTSLTMIENTVAMTGLDVDGLVEMVKSQNKGVGGPFVPVAGMGRAVASSANQLNRQMQRLRILQNVLSRLPLTPPLDSYWVSSHFGKRRDPYNGRWAMHEGIDMAGQPGLNVRAAAPGTVVESGWMSGYGRAVKIDHGYGLTTLYGHLKRAEVEPGDAVEHRGTIGKLGSTGRSTGPHVHYEIRFEGQPVDPGKFLKAGKHVFKK